MPSHTPRPGPLAGYQQHLEVETPENVVLDFEIAGIGSRTLAALLDVLLLAAWILGSGIIIDLMSADGLLGAWLEAILVIAVLLSYWSYFTFFEALRGGQTPGKRYTGIRVVRDTGHPITLGAAGARGLLRALDLFPPILLFDVLLIALHPRAKRLGDLVAGTIVVRDQPVEAKVPELPAEPATEESGAPELEEAEFRILREYIERSPEFTPELRRRFAARLSERFADRFPSRSPDPSIFLAQLYGAELGRRRSRFAVSRGSGSIAERFIARKSDRWGQFQALADRAARKGLDSLDPSELPDFAARYREVAADLARARTYGAPARRRHQLERLVAAGHNALYRDERKTSSRLWEILLRECPAAVLQSWRYVLVAMLSFAAPVMTGYFLVREQPALAQELLPDGMLRRAEAGVERKALGKGYYEADPLEQPGAATFLIGNNVRVAFLCFAGGALLGIGSLILLAFNGLSIGTTFGHFANLGLFSYIGTFVVGHGVLELFAICVAGAAGFLLGRSMIAPGDLSRRDALVINGRIAVRMVGAVVVMLTMAGVIEGFVSTSTEGLTYRLALGGASLLLLFLYLLNGAIDPGRSAARQGDVFPARTTRA